MKKLICIVLLCLLVYTRFVNLSWGLPYPFHPDERNMANAIQQLHCDISFQNFSLSDCLNPHFYAYGQLPLYVAYGLAHLINFRAYPTAAVDFYQATMALRIISALASVLTAIVLWKLIELLVVKRNTAVVLLLLTFIPVFIQSAHFGTTESLIMFFVSLLVYFSLRILRDDAKQTNYLLTSAVIAGLAMATKVSSATFIFLPLLALAMKIRSLGWRSFFFSTVRYIGILLLFFVIASPHNFISFPEFLGSMRYESEVGLGTVIPFYTLQFLLEQPIRFQLLHILPYALGLIFMLFSFLGFVFLSWKDKRVLFLRIALFLCFIPSAFLFAKWTRFLAPAYPLFVVFGIVFILKVETYVQKRFHSRILPILCFGIIVVLSILPGIAYLSVYRSPDVRFTASDWIHTQIPSGSFLLSETANVVDIPLDVPGAPSNNSYRINSFNLYDLDTNPELPRLLEEQITNADYIIVPSRRIFHNLTCVLPDGVRQTDTKKCRWLSSHYPNVTTYYSSLFSQQNGYTEVAEFSSFPKISFLGKTLISFPDENAEETWSVFDHPVIRIYKKQI